MLQGIVSIVPVKIKDRINFIREKICSQSGLKMPESEYKPHMTWQVVHEYDVGPVSEILSTLVKRIKPIKVETTGLGIFSGAEPIVYIPVVRTPTITEIQQYIWDITKSHYSSEWTLYRPDKWMPHITLLSGGQVQDSMSCIFEQLIFEDFHWEFELTNFELFQQNDDKTTEQLGLFKFGG